MSGLAQDVNRENWQGEIREGSGRRTVRGMGWKPRFPVLANLALTALFAGSAPRAKTHPGEERVASV